MSSTIYCHRCDSHITLAMRSFHDSACGPVAAEPEGYDPYNSAEKCAPLDFNTRHERITLPSLLRRQAG